MTCSAVLRVRGRSLFNSCRHVLYSIAMESLTGSFRLAETSQVARAMRLTSAERSRIIENSWFCSLSSCVRHELLRCVQVCRYRDGETVGGDGLEWAWLTCASGALRVCKRSIHGCTLALDHIEPGRWIGEALIVGEDSSHFVVVAHGFTTTLRLSRE